jgi:ABC-type multidrug transport system fused ATPase/permease subunit
MERNPLRLTWTTAPGRQLAAVLVLAAAGLLLLLAFDLVRLLVDDTGPLAPVVAQPFLRLTLPLPRALFPEPLILFEGISLEPRQVRDATMALLVAIPVAIGLLMILADWLAAQTGGLVLNRVRTRILRAILAAPASARDEAVGAAGLASDGLARESDILGSSVIATLRIGGMIAITVIYGLLQDWQLGLTMAAMFVLGGIAGARRLDSRLRTGRARHLEGERTQGLFNDLLARMPALRAHGTAPVEEAKLGRGLEDAHQDVRRREIRFAGIDVLATVLLLLTPLVVLVAGLAVEATQPDSPGALIATCMAAALGAFGIREWSQWRRLVERVRDLLTDAARSVSVLHTRARRNAGAALPRSGLIVARGLSGYDPATGGRCSGIDLTLRFPGHVALVGDGDSGAKVFAALLGGHIDPSTGRLTFGDVDLETVDPVERARRIAFAGDTILIDGTLRQNLVYGAVKTDDLDARLKEAVDAVGLNRLTHARGLAGTFDPAREPVLAASIVESRRAVRAALEAQGMEQYVDPFSANRYNRHATVGENMLFGKAVGDTFREDRLASHPFVRAILEATDLTKPLTRMGLSIATSMIEIFGDVPDGHPLFERFSFFASTDRPYFEDLVARSAERRRGAEPNRDRERLIGLALRYNEGRHRLGLLNEELQTRILEARSDFARMLPVSLRPAIEFYSEDEVCSAASVQDNLLFGRIASEQAGAEAAVQEVIRQVLTDRHLDTDVSRIGLDSPVDGRSDDLTIADVAAIDLVRCLVRQPDILVVERALDGLSSAAAEKLVANLKRVMVGRGLIIVSPDLTARMNNPPFDAVIRFERGEPAPVSNSVAREALAV